MTRARVALAVAGLAGAFAVLAFALTRGGEGESRLVNAPPRTPFVGVPLPAGWTRLASTPEPVAEPRLARLEDGRVLIAAHTGYPPEEFPARAWIFDPATETYEPVDPPIEDRMGARLVTLGDGTVLLGGGFSRAGSQAIERYDAASAAFGRLGTLLRTSSAQIGRLPSGRLAMLQGLGGAYRLATFDPETSEVTGVALVEIVEHVPVMAETPGASWWWVRRRSDATTRRAAPTRL